MPFLTFSKRNPKPTRAVTPRESALKRFTSSVGKALKTFGSNFFGVTWDGNQGWHGVNSSRYSARFPGSDMNWEAEAGPLTLNGVVSICLQYIFDKLIEPRVHVVFEEADGMVRPVLNHPCTLLLLNPNPEYRGNSLMAGLALSYKLDGNAYAIKVRGAGDSGKPTELWYVPHWQMFPLPPDDGGPTQFYVYMMPTASGIPKPRLIPRRNVVHIKNGMDPNNWRVGFSPTRAQLRAFVSDNEIDACTAIILRNKGILGTVISPAEGDIEITPEQADELKRRVREQTTGDNRADILTLNLPVKIDQINSSAQDMALTTIGDRPTARICAAFGIDPASVGLANTSTSSGGGEKYGSMRKESRESSYEQCMLPMLAQFAEAWTYELLIDFVGVNSQGLWVEYDYSRVRDLQENQDALHKRANESFKVGLLTQDEARMTIGRKPSADPAIGEKYYFQLVGPPAGVLGIIGADGELISQEPIVDELPLEDDEDDSAE